MTSQDRQRRPQEGPETTPLNGTRLLDVLSADGRELKRVLRLVTVPESYFFRDEGQMRALQAQILPDLIAHKRATNSGRLRVWSAAAAGGQELFTIAILLHGMLPDFASWDLKLVGTDVSQTQLERASSARYSERDLRTAPECYVDRYFTRNDDEYSISAELRRIVHFRFGNLLDPTTHERHVDLIMCRNVLIYFNAESVKKVVGHIEDATSPEGFVVLGHAEVTTKPPPPMHLAHHDDCY